MNRVARADIVDYQTYGDARDAFQKKVMAIKAPRRIHVGDVLTFLFETTDTIRYQIQEMMRVERMAREADIAHEIETYNALLGDEGELGCTLLIEIDSAEERDVKLRAWRALPDHLYVRTQDGRKVRPTYDPAQVGDDKLSSVQYLKFAVAADATPVAIGSDLPDLTVEAELTDEQRAALRADLQA